MRDERVSFLSKATCPVSEENGVLADLFLLMCEMIHGHEMTGRSNPLLIRIVTVILRLHEPRYCVQYATPYKMHAIPQCLPNEVSVDRNSRLLRTHLHLFRYTTTPQPRPPISLHLKFVEVSLGLHSRASLVRQVTVRLTLACSR